MTDSTPPVLAALERAAGAIEYGITEGETEDSPNRVSREADARLLRELRDVLSRAIVRLNELDPETQRKIAAMLDGGA